METRARYLIGVRRQLFDVGFDPNQYNMSGIVPLSILEDDKQDNYSDPNKNLSYDNNTHFESDDYDYDSDCSLGSLNSVYLNIKNNSKFKTQLMNQNSNLKETSRISRNIVTKTQVPRKNKLKIKKADSIKKLSIISFYGKQKSVTRRHLYSRQFHVSQQKKKKTSLKMRKTTYFNELRNSLINQKQRENLKIKNLIRNRLKEPIPLLKFNHKVISNIELNSENVSVTSSIEKLQQDQTNFVTNCKNILMKETHSLEYIKLENKISEPYPLFIHEFPDTDDFEDTDLVNSIIKRLNDEDIEFTDSKNNGQWNMNEVIYDETQVPYYTLL